MGRIDFETIAEQAIDQAEERYEAELEGQSLDGYEYDKETGCLEIKLDIWLKVWDT